MYGCMVIPSSVVNYLRARIYRKIKSNKFKCLYVCVRAIQQIECKTLQIQRF